MSLNRVVGACVLVGACACADGSKPTGAGSGPTGPSPSPAPTQTGQFQGRLTEAGFDDLPIGGARVEVTDGIAAGLSAITQPTGDFHLTGLSAKTNLRITKDGYPPYSVTVDTTAYHPGKEVPIELPLSGKRPEVSGTYTVTLNVADDCVFQSSMREVPEEARRRTYTAVLQQDGPRLGITLSRADGWTAKRLEGHAEPTHV